MTASESALARLIHPLPVERFLSDYFPAAHCVQHGAAQRLPECFRAPTEIGMRRLATMHKGRCSFANAAECPVMLPAENVNAAHLIDMGLSVVLNDISDSLAGMDEFMGRMAGDLGITGRSVRADAFAAPPGGGAPLHYDVVDVFSVQLTGSKTFHVAPMTEVANPVFRQWAPGTAPFEDLYPQSVNGFPSAEGVEFERIDMRAGSVLFMPRGTWHRTHAEEASLSISISLNPPIALQAILAQLRILLLQDARWRAPLYGLAAPGAPEHPSGDLVTALLSDLPEKVASMRVSDLQRTMSSEEARFAMLDDASLLQRAPNSKVVITGGPASSDVVTLEIRVSDISSVETTTIRGTVTKGVAPVMLWIGEQSSAFSVKQLRDQFPDMAEDVLQQVFETCFRGGLLKALKTIRAAASGDR